MKEIAEETQIKLLEYLDGKLNDAETTELLTLAEKNPALKSRLQELRGLSTYLSESGVGQPSKNFTQKVMSKLDQFPRPAGVSIWKSMVLLMGIFITIGIASLLVSAGTFDGTAQFDLNSIIFQNDYIKQSLPSIRFNGKIVVNAIIVLNMVIAFFVLDRTVFRPWFQRRSRFHF
jgi:hypothetical protein